ncbi:hypothetical protein EJ04DRAFT_431262 [Polyplosphaeria fusca]|uniref:Pre-rrna processing protein n=1 Tax=Polyplosphaeria fusca TaxID=682080 RepID=A0A9P4R5G3_9PLEO|nr:hypothetical protein EJ04DRAFT_431262 [Polyplosphaeria fusca]
MDTPDGPWASTRTPSERPASHRSRRSSRSARSNPSSRTTEETPLLARGDQSEDEDETEQTPAATSLLRSLSGSSTASAKTPLWKKRWPSILALLILCLVVVFIILGFLATEGIEEYAMQAADFKPTKLSLDSLTSTGVRVHVEGDFRMDASKVEKNSVRTFGRFGTWIAKEVESGPTNVDVYLPEYGNVLLGTAKVPGIKVNIRNGNVNHISVNADLEPGSLEGIRNIANDWIDGRLGQIRVKAKVHVPLKTGLIRLGAQTVEESMLFQGNNLPSLPRYNITRLNLREAKEGHTGMGADVSIDVTNQFPIDIMLPSVAVDVLVDGCLPSDEHIMVGTASTSKIHVRPKTDVHVNVTGRVDTLPDELTTTCPNSLKSPLDALLGDYMHGQDATIYINCCSFPDPDTPDWARDLAKDITVPVPVAGRDMGNMIKNFSLTDVHFGLPDPFAEPDTPEAAPKISAVVMVDIGLPDEMNIPINVSHVLADADIYYKKKKFGKLDLQKWQKANSTRIPAHGDEKPSLLVQSNIEKAPIKILDGDLFSEVVQALLFGTKPVMLDTRAAVSVKADSPLGQLVVREIPAEGVVPVKRSIANSYGLAIGHGKGDDGDKGDNRMGALSPKIWNLSITETSRTSLTLEALVNITNPTNYSATVPYFNINILVNGTVLGQAIARDVFVHPGNNTNIAVSAVWDPSTNSGENGTAVGKEVISQYISGFNMSLTLQTHNASIPAQPALGFALSKLPLTLPAPHLGTPKDPNDDDGGDDDPDDPDKPEESPHFIREATMHLISSTAIFTLASPFATTTLYITRLNATAFYEGHPSGTILYDLPLVVPPGLSTTPRLPVDWSLGSVGFGAIKKALGGTLRLSTYAEVGVRIGQFRQDLWYQGRSIGANIRP